MKRWVAVLLLLLLAGCHVEAGRRGYRNLENLLERLRLQLGAQRESPAHGCCASQVNGNCSVCGVPCPPYPWGSE